MVRIWRGSFRGNDPFRHPSMRLPGESPLPAQTFPGKSRLPVHLFRAKNHFAAQHAPRPPWLMVRTMGKDRTASSQTVAPLPATRGSKVAVRSGGCGATTTAVTSVEYAVMLALILGVILISIKLLGTNTKQLWTSNSTRCKAPAWAVEPLGVSPRRRDQPACGSAVASA